LKILSKRCPNPRALFEGDNIREHVSLKTIKGWGATSALLKSLKVDPKVFPFPLRSESLTTPPPSLRGKPVTAKMCQ
jgi:hypothetical protein